LDDFGLQSKTYLQKARLGQYFSAPIATIMNEKHWAEVESAVIMSCAHVIFRHSLLDQLLYSMTGEDIPAAKISPRIETITGTSKLNHVSFIFKE
jgi:hypothetical protein